METVKPPSPIESAKHFFENNSFIYISWIIIAFIIGYIIFLIARRQYRRNSYTEMDVFAWGTFFVFCTVFVIFVLKYPFNGGSEWWGYFLGCFLIAAFAVYSIHNELSKYQRLIIGLIIIAIGGFSFAAFVNGKLEIFLAIIFGFIEGAVTMFFFKTLGVYLKILKNTTAQSKEEDEKWEKEPKI